MDSLSATESPKPAASQPVIRSSLKRFLYTTERSDHGVTGFAGLPAVIETFHALGLAETAQRELRLKTRRRGLSEAQWVELLVMLHIAGGTCPEDLRIFKQDDGLRRLWNLPNKASARSVLDFLKRFHDPNLPMSSRGQAVIPPETAALRALGRVNHRLIAEIQRRRPVDTATIDVDASIHASDKDQALYTYEKTRGYQPVIAFWSEQELILHDEFRDGNVPAGMGNVQVLEGALQALPPGISRIYVRGDTALYEHKLLRFLDRQGVEFAISADVSRELRQAAAELDEEAWQPLPPREGAVRKEERFWAELPFVPDDPAARTGERCFRYLVIRLPPRTLQLDLFEPPEEPERYVAIVTNRDLPGPELIHWQREKCGTVEKAHDWLKHDVGARLFPSALFGANAAWYRLAVLALNLFQALGLTLPQEWQKDRLPTARFRFLNRAGRVIRHARRFLLVLSKLAQPLAETYIAVRRNLAPDTS